MTNKMRYHLGFLSAMFLAVLAGTCQFNRRSDICPAEGFPCTEKVGPLSLFATSSYSHSKLRQDLSSFVSLGNIVLSRSFHSSNSFLFRLGLVPTGLVLPSRRIWRGR